MELHLDHTDFEGHHSVLVFHYNISEDAAPTNSFLGSLIPFLSSIPGDNNSVNIQSLDFTSQVNLVSGYFHYEGSLTIPPCTEAVQWFIGREPIQVSPRVISQFTSILNNARPSQKLGDRKISLYTPGPADDYVRKWITAITFTGLGVLGILILVGLVRYAIKFVYLNKKKNEQELTGFLGSTNNEL